MSSIDRMQLIKNLRILREESGYCKAAISRKTGIQPATLTRFETGERIPTTEQLLILANFFNVTTDYILGRE